jgi:hypothetical protein
MTLRLTLPDSGNDRVLNLLQSIEPLLINYIRSRPEDRESAQKALDSVRKALAGEYDKLPEPVPEKKTSLPDKVLYAEIPMQILSQGQQNATLPPEQTDTPPWLNWWAR